MPPLVCAFRWSIGTRVAALRCNARWRTAMRLVAAACLSLLVLPTPSVADCAADLEQLRPRIDHIRTSDKQRYDIANKWFGEAERSEPDDEVQCHNFYIKAHRALTQPN